MRGRRIPIALPNSGILSRRKNSICLRTLAVILIVAFVVLQFHLINLNVPYSTDDGVNEPSPDDFAIVPQYLHKFLRPKERNESSRVNGSAPLLFSQSYHVPNISDMRATIRHYNAMQMVLNEDQFGPLDNDSVIIVVQVHTRITYLRHLIISLAQARNIEHSLLIFSHDFYNEDINELVQKIDFCKVMQIFYPHSIQTHPNEFPGVDPGDCPRNINRDQAIIRNCNNAYHPDLYGHYRESKFTQTKHHWWWKANRVFDQLYFTYGHHGMVLFLEEDHYVAEDFLHILKLMEAKAHEMCPKCNVLSLGTYLKTYNYFAFNNNNKVRRRSTATASSGAVETWGFEIQPTQYSFYQKVEVTPWVSSKHNMGFAFNRSTWREIVSCSSMFCTYDDYNWDWSLQHVSQQCMKHKLHAMVVKGPRVFHIGECGVHHKKQNCKSNQVIAKVQQVIRSASRTGKLFPNNLFITLASVVKKTKLRKGNGGWGDYRDHRLCQNMTERPAY